jgi:hypothetical protein
VRRVLVEVKKKKARARAGQMTQRRSEVEWRSKLNTAVKSLARDVGRLFARDGEYEKKFRAIFGNVGPGLSAERLAELRDALDTHIEQAQYFRRAVDERERNSKLSESELQADAKLEMEKLAAEVSGNEQADNLIAVNQEVALELGPRW